MFADQGQMSQLGGVETAFSPRPQQVGDQVQNSYGYGLALQGLDAWSGLRQLGRGFKSPLGAALSFAGMGVAGGSDAAFSPAKMQAQTAADTSWLGNARENDSFQGTPTFWSKKSMRRVEGAEIPDHEWQRLGRATDAVAGRHLALGGGFKLVARPGVKLSGGVTKISSPLQKEASLVPALRESMNMNAFPLPGASFADKLVDTVRYRPESLGGPSKGKALAMQTGEVLKSLLVSNNIVTNASGMPIGVQKEYLPGLTGKLLRIPLAIGGLMAINAGIGAVSDFRRKRTADNRFDAALERLRNDEAFADYGDLLDPESEVGKETLPKIREGFEVLEKYSPTVAEDPKLAAQFLESFARNAEGFGLTGDQYLQSVRGTVALENEIDRQKSKVSPMGQLLGTLVSN